MAISAVFAYAVDGRSHGAQHCMIKPDQIDGPDMFYLGSITPIGWVSGAWLVAVQ